MRRTVCSSIVAGTFAAFVATAQSGELAVFDSGAFSLTFEKAHFDKVTTVVLPKTPGSASPAGSAGPRRHVLELHHQSRSPSREAGRYYWPSSSAIYITPLYDASVKDFAAAYPSLHKNALALRKILLLTRRQFYAEVDRPSDAGEWRADLQWTPFSRPRTTEQRSKQREPLTLPDEPFSNAGAYLLAHYKRLTQPNCTGYRVLTYYRNAITGYGATNAELHYQYQGFTADQKFFVTARLAVRHDRLPDSIDDPRAASDETEAEQMAERKRITRWKESSFVPPLTALDDMIGSLRIKS